MRSMTGYGKGEAAEGGLRLSVEIQSFNRKQIDLALTLPKGLQPLEARVREMLLARVSRGRLNVTVHLNASAETVAATAIDIPLARTYAAAMAALRDELGLGGEVTLDAVLRAPGVLGTQTPLADPEPVWRPLADAVGQALDQVVSMREAEGAHLAGELHTRLELIRALAERIAGRAPEILRRHRQQLQARLRAADWEVTADEERVAKELVLYADKSDISEELARLQSHFHQFAKLLTAPEPAGRTLEFLTQEIAREMNTLSVKSNDAETSQLVVEAKVELERIREQIQNIE
jgi:uncharacterized protein (TIGR00255 family)